VTAADMVRGKPGYLAPEQALGDVLDHRVDLFGVGLTLHEALTGRRLLGDPISEQARKLLATDLPPPSSGRPDTPPALDQIVSQLLQRLPANRTATADALVESLLALEGPASPQPMGRESLVQMLVQAADPGALTPAQEAKVANLKTRPMPASGTDPTAPSPTLQSTRP
jgi:serine/threonine protein kinase